MDIKAARASYDCRVEIPALMGWKPNGQNQYPCPIGSHGNTSPSFTCYKDGCYCFTCQNSWDYFDMLAWYHNKPLKEILQGFEIDPEQEARRKREHAEREANYKRERIAAVKDALAVLRALKPHKQYFLNQNGKYDYWNKAGMPDWYVEHMWLGVSVQEWYGQEKFSCASMTIPCYNLDKQICGIQHRLIGAPEKAGKYRVEPRAKSPYKFPPPLFMAWVHDIDTTRVYICEGAKKAAVFWLTMGSKSSWVVGITSKMITPTQAKQLEKAKTVYFIPDPDVTEGTIMKTRKMLADKKFYVLDTVKKIDDAIIENNISTAELRGMLNMSRRIK